MSNAPRARKGQGADTGNAGHFAAVQYADSTGTDLDLGLDFLDEETAGGFGEAPLFDMPGETPEFTYIETPVRTEMREGVQWLVAEDGTEFEIPATEVQETSGGKVIEGDRYLSADFDEDDEYGDLALAIEADITSAVATGYLPKNLAYEAKHRGREGDEWISVVARPAAGERISTEAAAHLRERLSAMAARYNLVVSSPLHTHKAFDIDVVVFEG